MNNKLIGTILVIMLYVIASGCASNTNANNTSNANPIMENTSIENTQTNITIDLQSSGISNGSLTNSTATQYPNIHADVTPIDSKHVPMQRAPVPMPMMKASTLTTSSATVVAATQNKGVSKINQVYSYNWAGYAVDGTNGSVSNVKGSWIVPQANARLTAHNQYSCNWIGMDGDNSGTVEQIGTDSDIDDSGNPVYYAWYEFYPEPCYRINKFPVKANDRITAEVRYDKKLDCIVLTIYDMSSGKSFSTLHPAAGYTRSSAEWITEAPYSNGILPLTNFGITTFGNTYVSKGDKCTATIGKTTGAIDSFGNSTNKITMVSQNTAHDIMAQPSDLIGKGTSFKLTWVRAL